MSIRAHRVALGTAVRAALLSCIVFLFLRCNDETTAPPPVDGSRIIDGDILPEVEGIINLTTGCSDKLASNYRESVAPENDDCSCVYEDFEKPVFIGRGDTYFRNVLLEGYSSTRTGAEPVMQFLFHLTESAVKGGAEQAGIGTEVLIINTHPQGEEASLYAIDRYEAFKEKFPDLKERISNDSEETDFRLPYYSVDNNLTARSSYFFNPRTILEAVAGRLSPIPDVYISLQSDYVASEGVLEGLLALKFRPPDDGKSVNRSYEILLVEDKVVASQANGAPNVEGVREIYSHLYEAPTNIQDYVHKNLVREKVAEGQVRSLLALRGAGTYSRAFKYFVPLTNSRTQREYNFEHLYLIVIVSSSDENVVLNSKIVPLSNRYAGW